MQAEKYGKKVKMWIYILTFSAIALVEEAIYFAVYFTRNISYASENKSSKN